MGSPRRRAGVTAGLLVLTLGLGGLACSADDADDAAETTVPDEPTETVAVGEYADTLCSALLPLPEQVAAITLREVPEGADFEAVRTDLLADLATVRDTLTSASSAMAATPPPDVDGGDATADRNRRALARAEAQMGQVIAYITAAPEATEEVLFEGYAVLVVTEDLYAVLNGDPIPLPAELGEAFAESENCLAFAEARTATAPAPPAGAPTGPPEGTTPAG